MRIVKWVGKRFLVALLIWVAILTVYGAAWTPVESSPLYNSPAQETKVCFIYIPILSLGLSVALGILVPSIDKEIFMDHGKRVQRAIRHSRRAIDQEIRREGPKK